jgi:ABC-type nitrate/sulfonate/bicarbonate transport system substrate-binding protein
MVRYGRFVFSLAVILIFSSVFVGTATPTLRLSLPPVMGCLPIAFANGWGMFTQNGLDVQVVGLSDNQARTLALMAGEIDAMICDVSTAVLLVANGIDIVITSTAYQPEQTGSMALLTQSYFRIESVDDLLNRTKNGNTTRSIGIIEMSDIEYALDSLLISLGHTADSDKHYSYWHNMLQLSMFLNLGSVYAAVLPEPYITYLCEYPPIKPGTKLIHLSDFEGIDILPSVVVFRREAVEQFPETVAQFYDVYREAIDKINQTDRDELMETGINIALSLFFPGLTEDSVPEGVLDKFKIPQFSYPAMLAKEKFEDVIAWEKWKGYTWKHPVYEDVTTDQFVR